MKKYSIDPANRLVIIQNKKKIIAEGDFDIDAKNRLVYWLNEPVAWKRKYGLGRQVTFEGNWRLNSDHDLEFSVGSGPAQAGESRLRLKAEMISAGNNELVFEIQSRDRNGNSHIRIIRLGGAWQADERNRLTFVVCKNDPDTLTLEGAWQINKDQEIVYKYEKAGKAGVQTFVFEGAWDINAENRLSYVLSGGTGSRFDFHVQAGSPSIYPQQGKIKYALGVGLKNEGVPRLKVIYLYGKWKINRSGGLSFELDYGRGRLQAIEFGAQVNLNKKNNIIFALNNKKGESLGVSVTFSRRFLKKLDAEAFVRLETGKRSGSGVDIGARIPF